MPLPMPAATAVCYPLPRCSAAAEAGSSSWRHPGSGTGSKELKATQLVPAAAEFIDCDADASNSTGPHDCSTRWLRLGLLTTANSNSTCCSNKADEPAAVAPAPHMTATVNNATGDGALLLFRIPHQRTPRLLLAAGTCLRAAPSAIQPKAAHACWPAVAAWVPAPHIMPV